MNEFKIGDIVTPRRDINYNEEFVLQSGFDMEVIYLSADGKFCNTEGDNKLFLNLKVDDLGFFLDYLEFVLKKKKERKKNFYS